MKNYFTKKNLLIAGGILLLALLANNARAAEVSGMAGVQSDYIYRGINQSQGPSAWAGLQLNMDSGLYGRSESRSPGRSESRSPSRSESRTFVNTIR